MADDHRSTLARARKHRKLLVVANPNPDDLGSSSSDDNAQSSQTYTPQSYQYHPYYQPPVTSPSALSPPLDQQSNPSGSHKPHPLRTNLTENQPGYSHSRSNPTLSSPSSASSPAVESTPPPSTPGHSVEPVDLNGDNEQSTEPQIRTSSSSIDVPSTHSRNLYDRIKCVPQMVARSTRRGSSHKRPATSPTVSTSSQDTYMSPSSAIPGKVFVLVTTDSEHYSSVDISGRKDSAFIRERIYTSLRISDEDQPYYSIYLTDIGAYALGEALSDEQLFEICCTQGDSRGSVKFFVSHSSARVHDPSNHASSPVTGSYPPPVLVPSPLSPKRGKPGGRPRLDSASSASEPVRDVAAGYEPSVSDMDDGDGSTNRHTIRPPARHASTKLKGAGPPVSPSTSGRAQTGSYGPGTTTSPVNQSGRPLSPAESWFSGTSRTRTMENLRVDKQGGSSSSPYNARTPEPSKYTPQPDPYAASSAYPALHARTASDAAADRERGLRDSENRLEYADKYWNSRKESRDRYAPRQDSESGGTLDRKGERDPWVLVPHDIPSNPQGQNRVRMGSTQELSRSPPSSRSGFVERERAERKLRNEKSVSRLAIPNPPRNPPPPPPAGLSDVQQQRMVSSGRQGHALPPSWNASYKSGSSASSKADNPWPHKLVPTKSMNDLRGPSIPSALVPGGLPGARRGNALPVSGSPNEQRTLKSQISSATLRSTYDSSRAGGTFPPSGRPPSRPLPAPNVSRPSTSESSRGPTPLSGAYANLLSPTREPYVRPSSASGEPVSSLEPQSRNVKPGFTAADFVSESDKLRSIHAANLMRSVANTSRDEGAGESTQSHALSKSQADLHSERPLDVYGGLADASNVHSTKTPPRSPVSPQGPRPERSHFDSALISGDTPHAPMPNQSTADESFEATLKSSEHAWIAQMLDGRPPESTLTPPHSLKPNPTQSYVPPPPLGERMNSFDDTGSLLSTDDNSDSGDDEGTGLWARPPLTVETRTFPPPPPPPPMSSENSHRGNRRISVFVNDDQDTWAVRPPPEDVYERLEEFFPGHDLDKPVIDANSGGTSPTATEQPIPIPPDPPEKRWRHKKSIRVVAAEHKKKIDRTSHMESSSTLANNVRRHRSTKLWDSKTEEMTAEKLKASIPESPSPSVGPKPIFKWVRGELIGKGTYGKVYLALNATTGEMIAVKQVEIPRTASDKNDTRQVSFVQALKQESETLKDLDHPNIVQYLGFEETPTHLSIFLEYVPGGSIGSCLKKHGKFDESVTKSFTGQILSGLEYLHSKGILHRDLKADNILVEASGVCKISDFGISKRTDDVNANGQFTAMQGSVFWMAPEVINSKENGYNSKIDIWSVGCVVLEMWAGERPWSSEEMIAVMFKLYGKATPPIPRNVRLSRLADDFRQKCFAINPDDRPTAAELRRHKYLTLPPDWGFNGFK